jgi:hypothetical protein
LLGVGGELVALGDDVAYFHAEVGEGVAEGADPARRRLGYLVRGHFAQRVEVAVVDDLDQSVDERVVVCFARHRLRYMITLSEALRRRSAGGGLRRRGLGSRSERQRRGTASH